MFNPRKSDNFPGSTGTIGILIAALLAILLLGSLFSSGTALKVLLGVGGLFAIWWLYDTYLRKTPKANEFSKYRKAVAQQKKKKPAKSASAAEGSKVVYLEKFRRKQGH